jgi:hypothetical protein
MAALRANRAMPAGQVDELVVIPYKPRKQFLPFHNRNNRFACLVVHRRGGKTVASINELIKATINCQNENPRFAYVAPYHAQAKDVAWEYLKHYSAPIPGVSFNESELRVDYPHGGRIRLYGAENADRMRGLYFDGIVIDEPADINPRVWPEIIRPALADRQGWATFIGTPKGHNSFYDIYTNALKDETWFTMMLRASESGLIKESELDAARINMNEDQYAQEFECSFEAAILGAYYGRQMDQVDRDGRITSVAPIPSECVHTAWDLGVRDSTAIWFFQKVANEIRVVDYYENSGVGLEHYVAELGNRKYAYGSHIFPHDIEVKELGSGTHRRDVLAKLGISDIVVAPKLSVAEGIHAVRMALPTCWFDSAKCASGIEALRQYRHEWDDERKTFRGSPLHDWTSHAADSFRYMAVSLNMINVNKNVWTTKIKYDNRGIT